MKQIAIAIAALAALSVLFAVPAFAASQNIHCPPGTDKTTTLTTGTFHHPNGTVFHHTVVHHTCVPE